MTTWWSNTKRYLGLDTEAEYVDYPTEYDDPIASSGPINSGLANAPASRSALTVTQPSSYEEESSAIGAVRPMGLSAPGGHDFAAQVSGSPLLAPVTAIGSSNPMITPSQIGDNRPRPKVVRPLTVDATARPRIIAPISFNQAQALADTFKGGQPVLINLREADREVARRLIDFSSGLCYALGGGMEKLDTQIYLVSPSHVEVSSEERARLRDRDYQD